MIISKQKYLSALGLLACFSTLPTHAEEIATSGVQENTPIKEVSASEGVFKITGAVRMRLDAENPSRPNQPSTHFGLDTIRIGATYDSDTISGKILWRFYGGSYPYSETNGYRGTFGEVNFPELAYLSYKLNSNDNVSAGLIETPFGVSRFYGSTFYLGLGNVLGVEDATNMGLKWSRTSGASKIDLAYLYKDAGSYTGPYGNDRYSSNISIPGYGISNGTNNTEQSSIVGRYSYQFQTTGLKHELGGSVWYGQIKNRDTNSKGDRLYLALFDSISYGSWSAKLQITPMMIRPKNPMSANETVSMGGFDGSYNAASRGTLYSADLSYAFGKKFGDIHSITPYINYSRYSKNDPRFKESERLITGVSFAYKQVYTYLEYRLGKNDPYTNVSRNYENGIAQGGNNRWDSVFYMNIGYYF